VSTAPTAALVVVGTFAPWPRRSVEARGRVAGSAASVPCSAGQAGRTQGTPWQCAQVPPGHLTRDARVRNSRTKAVADPMILWEGWDIRSLASRSAVSPVPGSRRDPGDDGPPRRRQRRLRRRRSRRRTQLASPTARAPHDAPRADRSQEPRRQPSPARSQMRRAKPICRSKSLASRRLRHTERSQSRRPRPAPRKAASRAQDGSGAASGGRAEGSRLGETPGYRKLAESPHA
jgi:hypothetical protein